MKSDLSIAIAAVWIIVQVPRPSLHNKSLDPLRRPRPGPGPRQTRVRVSAVHSHDRRKRLVVDHVHVRDVARLVLSAGRRCIPIGPDSPLSFSVAGGDHEGGAKGAEVSTGTDFL
jgi:hypothetical protein